ncbi:MAG: S8 family serine peptidase, partial [Candidatus Eisenbacteria bacterium]|nr:S8 family serine peptidase [Candidatus Eisenbacteria bacterium]
APDRAVEGALAALEDDSSVMWAEPNGTYTTTECPDCPQDPFLIDLPYFPNQWGVFKTNVTRLWRYGGGGEDSIVIAIVDTGIDDFSDPHPHLAANVLATGHDFVDDDADPTDEGPWKGHGTHVAGIAGAVADKKGMTGIAYCSKLLFVRVLDCTAGSGCPGSWEDIADGIQYAADQGARVINMSLGGQASSNTVRAAVHYALAERSLILAAAGNDSLNSVSFPARIDEVIAVGASDPSDAVAAFSNWGPELDLVAPGVDVWSTIPGGYDAWDGTSMATPFVAGVAALIAHRNPAITQSEMEDYLRANTADLAGDHDGYGRLDFLPLEDWSDARGSYIDTVHDTFFWEWLGADGSFEPDPYDPIGDTDGRPNKGGPHDVDGHDDGVFPRSSDLLPWIPEHVGGENSVRVGEEVCRHDGGRYTSDADSMLYLDVWCDWNSNEVFEDDKGEHSVMAHAENPAIWGGNVKELTLDLGMPDEHVLGNPLVVRTRLSHGMAAPDPETPMGTGEVEDDMLINFFEDFDTALHTLNPGVFMDMGDWSLSADPGPLCEHHGAYEFAVSGHPGPGSEVCNGMIEGIYSMSTPFMDWSEYTDAYLRFWYCHQVQQCSEVPDFCRVRIDTCGVPIDLGPIPFGSGTAVLDLSDFVGCDAVRIEFIEETDWWGGIAIDDVAVWAYDDDKPVAITDLAVTRTAGNSILDLEWTATSENSAADHPPADPLAHIAQWRYADHPIATESDWDRAMPVTPRDVVGGPPLPVPDPSGSTQSLSFWVPSAFQTYHVAGKIGDEVVNLSDLSNSASDSTAPSLGVVVLNLEDGSGAPGDTVALPYVVANSGDVTDSYFLSASDTKGWGASVSKTLTTLAAGDADTVSATVAIPGGASTGDIDTLFVSAKSISDPAVIDDDLGSVEVSSASDVAVNDLPARARLEVLGPNPFRSDLRFEVGLPAPGRVSLRIYDPAGRLVRSLLNGRVAEGRRSLAWDGLDDRARPVAAGLYFLELRASGAKRTARVLKVD